ncbi:Box C/D snoRNA protein 1 [Morella rubra]|uniref:Box C/D snoRNA protein 1 n=1 Tax=Morella rubra TaxID=262757 RepID=A0A6A1WMC5_9ROSI|nr:Box C/D snoRNA protein 1 [Morella rubra]
MEGQDDPPLCEECKANPSKYKCPGCSARSCSLPCVKAHKERIGCTGKRNQTQFVPLCQFDNNLLLSDYNLLEEVKRVAESAQRTRTKLCGYAQFKLPFHLRSLRNAAASRRTKLLLLPSGMSKREKNRTRYDQRKKSISWTIEWRFRSTDIVLQDHGVNENANLCSILENHLKPGPWNHQLRQFCEEQIGCLKFFIREYPKGPRSPFRELDIKAPIRQQFANLVILEYPVIFVFLPSQSFDFEVVKDANLVTPKTELKDSGSNPRPEGVPFKEEEIEDNNSPSDPPFFDLMKHATSSPMHLFPPLSGRSEKAIDNSSAMNKRFEKAVDNTAESPLVSRVAIGNNSHSFSNSKKSEASEMMEFDFDQGLIDSYSELIAQINPDDFLDLEGEFAEEVDVEGRRDLSALPGYLSTVEELEEGEILE